MRRRRLRLAALISGSTPTALRWPASHAQLAAAGCVRRRVAGDILMLRAADRAEARLPPKIPPTPIQCQVASFLEGLERPARRSALCWYNAGHDTRGNHLRT